MRKEKKMVNLEVAVSKGLIRNGNTLCYTAHICKYGVIPTCKAGRKYLINWNVLMDYLNGNFFELPNKSNNENKIRKLK